MLVHAAMQKILIDGGQPVVQLSLQVRDDLSLALTKNLEVGNNRLMPLAWSIGQMASYLTDAGICRKKSTCFAGRYGHEHFAAPSHQDVQNRGSSAAWRGALLGVR